MPHPEPPQPAATPRRFRWRRLLQYRLGALLVFYIVIAIWLAWCLRTLLRQGEVAHRGQEQERISILIATLNERPDLLHSDYTPAVHELIKIGQPAIEPLLDVMLDANEGTRKRAERALDGITSKMHGFRAGQGWNDPHGEGRFRKFWKSLGSYNWDDSEQSRRTSIAKWRDWVASGSTLDP